MTEPSESFPRQRARTRGFRLGAPRAFRIARLEDGTARVVFVRSADGRTASGDLWVMDEREGWEERLVVRSESLAPPGELPAAERARRERLREVTSGITGYSLDNVGCAAAFAVDGIPYRVDLDTAVVRELSHPGPVIDPQISPDGQRVAYVCGGRVFVVDDDAARAVSPDSTETTTWGLADFIAAEELERHRGMWWTADSLQLIVERVDESNVDVRWIADPAQPEREPEAHRYPSAGTKNADVSLHLIDIGTSESAVSPTVELAWDRAAFPYLLSVHIPATDACRAVLSVMSRDQRRQLILTLTGNELSARELREQSPWVTVMAGVPTVDSTDALIEILDVDGCFRVCRDGQPLSPSTMNVDGVLDVSATGVVVSAAIDSVARVVANVDFNGATTIVSPERAWSSAVVAGDTRVEAQATLDNSTTRVHIVDGARHIPIRSLAEKPSITPKPSLSVVGERDLRVAVMLPTDHEPGRTWPVICSPYGGPHAQRVINAAGAYLTEQWLADQGFAVVVIDGRGTPGRGPAWEYAVHHDLAGPVLQDQVDALQAVAEAESALDLSHVGIRGWSFGGYLAALAVLERPDVFHAAVAGAPVTDWRLYDTAYTERYLGNPNDDDTPYERTSLLNRGAQLSRPLLLIHGLADDNVLAAHTLQLSSALLAAGKQHNVLPLSGVTHMTPQEVIAENLLLTEVDFFRTYLGSES
ncbi:MAG: prolyl oligopeptidase family serine peptidase [Candidatus Nanopelagicales bacterium]